MTPEPAPPDTPPGAPEAEPAPPADAPNVAPTIDAPPGAAPRAADGAVMPLVDHLSELRTRIVWSLIAIAVGTAAGFLVSEEAMKVLAAPLPTNQPLLAFDLGEAFAIRLRISLIIGIILAMPVLLWHVWRFVAPGLTPTERRAVAPWIPAALAFFAVGVAIAYAILPFAAQFLLSFQTPTLVTMLAARPYFDFVSTMFLAFGILMEFPVLLVGLSRVGIVTSQRLRRSRRFALAGIAVFATIATPGGDLVSPIVLGATLYLLFELTIVVIRRSGR